MCGGVEDREAGAAAAPARPARRRRGRRVAVAAPCITLRRLPEALDPAGGMLRPRWLCGSLFETKDEAVEALRRVAEDRRRRTARFVAERALIIQSRRAAAHRPCLRAVQPVRLHRRSPSARRAASCGGSGRRWPVQRQAPDDASARAADFCEHGRQQLHQQWRRQGDGRPASSPATSASFQTTVADSFAGRSRRRRPPAAAARAVAAEDGVGAIAARGGRAGLAPATAATEAAATTRAPASARPWPGRTRR